MARPSDEKLIAYLDGGLDPSEHAVVARWLDHDLRVRLRCAALAESAARLRAACDEVLREPVPARLMATARGAVTARRPWGQWAVAASLVCLFLGAGLGWFAAGNRGGDVVASTSVLDIIVFSPGDL